VDKHKRCEMYKHGVYEINE